MGVAVMIIGDSGSGKSTSLRNFDENEIAILNVAGKPLPFKKKLPMLNHARYNQCLQALQDNKRKCYVIDDSSYLMAFDNFRRAKESGYNKFTEMAVSFEQLLEAAIQTDDDTIVYFLHHYEDGENGKRKPKSIGKMLSEKLVIEGLFPIVIECKVEDGKHVFITTNDGYNCAKAPMDMLPDVMDNDLAEVDRLIRDYWGMQQLAAKKGGK